MTSYVYRARCGYEVIRETESPERSTGVVVETDKPLTGQNERVEKCAGCGFRCQSVTPEGHMDDLGQLQTVWVRKCNFRLVCIYLQPGQ